MTFPPLPTPTVIDGRRLYTAGDMRAYGQACADAERDRLEPDAPTGTNNASSSSPEVEFFRGMMGMK